MTPAFRPAKLLALACRGCLRRLDGDAQAGLCGRCWSLLTPLPETRCPICALDHGWGLACPRVPWTWGDALWDYHGGLGALLVPGIKRGELGWKAALLARAARLPLPDWAGACDRVCSAPTAGFRRWLRGFDLAEEASALFARRLGIPFTPVLRKPLFARAQAGLPESQRRRQPARVTLGSGAGLEDANVLLVDDVWTTGTTLCRCARVLLAAGAQEVRVLALFRAGRR